MENEPANDTEPAGIDRLTDAFARIATALSESGDEAIALAADITEAVAEVLEDRAIDAAGQ